MAEGCMPGSMYQGGHVPQRTCVARSKHGRGHVLQGVCMAGGMHGGGVHGRGTHGRGVRAGETAIEACGTHPTGMYSCQF